LKKLIFIFFVFFTFSLAANQDSKYKKLFNLAEKLSYNFEFDSCEVIIQKLISNNHQNPQAYLLKSKIHLWYFLGSKEKEDYELFFDYSDSVIFKTDQLLKQKENDPHLIYVLGNIYKYRAMAFGSNGNTLDAFWATKKAVSFFEDVIDIDSTFYSAYGGIGVFEYALGYVPALFNWAVSLSGLSADQQNGFTFIQKAAEKGKLDRIEYSFHLAKLYDEHMADYTSSIGILNSLITNYPNNTLFRYQAAIEYIKTHKLNKALKELDIVLKINHPKFSQTNSFSNFLLGDIYFRKKEYKNALEYYLAFLTTTKTIDYTGIASLRTAYCYYFLDNIKEFRRYAILSSNGNLDLEDDKFAKEMSLNVLGNGFSDEHKLLIEVENSFLAGDYTKGLSLINNNIDSLKVDHILAQLKYYMSSILIEQKNFDSAEKALNGIDTLDLKSAEWVEPMSALNLAKIYIFKKNKQKALEMLELAEDNNDYQNRNLISSTINGLRKKIKKK
jgi:predicted negative regulator of RcsB-dependent stress response